MLASYPTFGGTAESLRLAAGVTIRSASDGGNVDLLVASTLDKRAIAAVRADLTDLFRSPRGTAAIAPASAPAKPAGAVLAGNIVRTRHGIYLALEAPSVRRGDLHISRGADGPRIRVQVRNGYGRVEDPAHLSSLFGADHPSRESSNWACVLWERLGAGHPNGMHAYSHYVGPG